MAEAKTKQTKPYKWTENLFPGDRSRRIIFEGTTSAPERFIDFGGEAELSEDDLAQWSTRHKFEALDGEELKAYNEDKKAAEKAEEDGEPVTTREEQQRSQAEGSQAQGPGASTSQVSKRGAAGEGDTPDDNEK